MSIRIRSILSSRNFFAAALAIGLVGFAPSAFAGVCEDTDDDGVCDFADNCIDVPNFDQTNTNKGDSFTDPSRDQFGNACDADFNNDGLVSLLDLHLLGRAFNTVVGDEGYEADCDLNGDGVIGGPDWTILRAALGSSPGPSGPDME